MYDLQKLKDIVAKEDNIASMLGFQLDEVREGYAVGSFELQECHKNAHGSVNGGCLYTLADMISGIAAMTHGDDVTTVSGNFNYLRPAINTKRVRVIAEEVKYGSTLGVYDIKVVNDDDVILDTGTFTFFRLGQQK